MPEVKRNRIFDCAVIYDNHLVYKPCSLSIIVCSLKELEVSATTENYSVKSVEEFQSCKDYRGVFRRQNGGGGKSEMPGGGGALKRGS